VTYSSWRWIFLVNVPIGIVHLLLASRFIPRTKPANSGQPLDITGGFLLAGVLLPAMLAISLLGSGNVRPLSIGFLGPVLVGVAALVLFVRHTATATHPFIPVRMLYGAPFGVLNVINLLYGGAVLGFASLVPLYAVERFHVPTLESGTLLNAGAIGMIGSAALVSMLLPKVGHPRVAPLSGITRPQGVSSTESHRCRIGAASRDLGWGRSRRRRVRVRRALRRCC
jgi:hypothetical protein